MSSLVFTKLILIAKTVHKIISDNVLGHLAKQNRGISTISLLIPKVYYYRKPFSF